MLKKQLVSASPPAKSKKAKKADDQATGDKMSSDKMK
jgi:hypothetical protein